MTHQLAPRQYPRRRGTMLAAAAAALLAAGAGATHAGTVTFNNGPGAGSVLVTVDGYGSFGAGLIGNTDNGAVYDPTGATVSLHTVRASAVAVGGQSSGVRRFLTTADFNNRGNQPDVDVVLEQTAAGPRAVSSFSLLGLDFNLVQTLRRLPANQTGSMLTQTYTVTNASRTAVANFDLTRYIDADVLFDDPSLSNEGGGQLVTSNGTELLFQTDTPAGPDDDTIFVAIEAAGGSIPEFNRFAVDRPSDLEQRIALNLTLADFVNFDGPDADQFIDPGQESEVSAALIDAFIDIPPGGTVTYTTRTYFGEGAPTAVNAIPLPPAAWAGAAVMGATAAVGAWRRVRGQIRARA